jgi:hypothetical protein
MGHAFDLRAQLAKLGDHILGLPGSGIQTTDGTSAINLGENGWPTLCGRRTPRFAEGHLRLAPIQQDCAPIALRHHGDDAAPLKESQEISNVSNSISIERLHAPAMMPAPTSFHSFSFGNTYPSLRADIGLIACTFPSGCFWLWPTHQQQPTSRRDGRHMPKRSHKPLQATPPRAY